MELKVREFCAFDCIEQLFFHDPCRNNYLKKTTYFEENKVKVHIFEVCVLWPR